MTLSRSRHRVSGSSLLMPLRWAATAKSSIPERAIRPKEALHESPIGARG
jgi:hypothetical protein